MTLRTQCDIQFLFFLLTFLEKDYLEDHKVWLSQIQMKT